MKNNLIKMKICLYKNCQANNYKLNVKNEIIKPTIEDVKVFKKLCDCDKTQFLTVFKVRNFRSRDTKFTNSKW